MKHLIASFLNIAEPPRIVETIFVLAGKENRKSRGIATLEAGIRAGADLKRRSI